jgi:uncharacterized membrane protein YbhN (UPF0104 family)
MIEILVGIIILQAGMLLGFYFNYLASHQKICRWYQILWIIFIIAIYVVVAICFTVFVLDASPIFHGKNIDFGIGMIAGVISGLIVFLAGKGFDFLKDQEK